MIAPVKRLLSAVHSRLRARGASRRNRHVVNRPGHPLHRQTVRIVGRDDDQFPRVLVRSRVLCPPSQSDKRGLAVLGRQLAECCTGHDEVLVLDQRGNVSRLRGRDLEPKGAYR